MNSARVETDFACRNIQYHLLIWLEEINNGVKNGRIPSVKFEIDPSKLSSTIHA